MHLQGHPAVRPELDLVEQEDQLTHEISLEEKIDPEITLGKVLAILSLLCCLLIDEPSTLDYLNVCCGSNF